MPRLFPSQFHLVFEPILPQGSYWHQTLSSPYYLWSLLFRTGHSGLCSKATWRFLYKVWYLRQTIPFYKDKIQNYNKILPHIHQEYMSCQTILLYLWEAFPDPSKNLILPTLLPPFSDLESSTDSFAWGRIIHLLVSHSVTPLKSRNVVLLFVLVALAFNPVPDT